MNRHRFGCQVVFLYVFVAICVTRIAAAVRVNTEPIYRPHRLNVCEPNARAFDPKIVCYCDKIAHDEEFRKADCWVYGNELTEDDVAWDGFGRNNDIKELTFIVYTNSHLRFLPQKGMYYLTDLVKFSLSYADVPNIPAYAFSKLDRLEDVQLVSNQISSLDDYAFSKLDQLKALNLSYNQITEIKRHVFYRNFKMELLHLTSNNITSIRERAFGDLNNLVELRLDHNYLRQLKKGMFNGLTNLVQLSVTGNFITAIEEDTFEHVPSLIRLDLDQNSIQVSAVSHARTYISVAVFCYTYTWASFPIPFPVYLNAEHKWRCVQIVGPLEVSELGAERTEVPGPEHVLQPIQVELFEFGQESTGHLGSGQGRLDGGAVLGSEQCSAFVW